MYGHFKVIGEIANLRLLITQCHIMSLHIIKTQRNPNNDSVIAVFLLGHFFLNFVAPTIHNTYTTVDDEVASNSFFNTLI